MDRIYSFNSALFLLTWFLMRNPLFLSLFIDRQVSSHGCPPGFIRYFPSVFVFLHFEYNMSIIYQLFVGFLFVVCFCLCICLIFIQPRVFQDTQICGLIYVINFAKFLANITSDISVLFFFSFWHCNHVYVIPLKLPHSS